MLTVLTHLLHIFGTCAKCFWDFFAAFFSAVKICGLGLWPYFRTACPVSSYTHYTLSNSQLFSRLMVIVMNMLWPWMLTRLQDSMLSDMTHLLHTFTFYLFFWSHGCWAPALHSCRRPWPHCAWCGSVLHSLEADLSSFWLSNLVP